MLSVSPVFVSTAVDSDLIKRFANTPTFSAENRFAKVRFSSRQ